MKLGDYIFPGSKIYGPWMARNGDNAIFTYEVVDGTTGSLLVQVLHKNTEDTGPGEAVSPGVTFSAVSGTSTSDFFEGQANGLKELVRLSFENDAAAAAGNEVLFRTLDTNWFDTPNA